MTGIIAATTAKSAILPGWAGTATGLTAIGACVVLGWFAPKIVPQRWKRAHPWLHRLLAVLAYCGACALLVTPIGAGAIHGILSALGLLGGVSSGWVYAAVTVAALALLLTLALAVTTQPHAHAIWYAIGLVVVLALVPGGWFHQLLAATSGPGQAGAAWFTSLLGGHH